MNGTPVAVTKDPIVNTVLTLAALLGETTLAREDAESATHAAIDLSATITEELHSTRMELESAYRRCSNLEDELSFQRNRTHHVTSLDYARAIKGYKLLATTTPDQHKNKIALIKDVRIETGLGLKEAKDLVEAYLDSVAIALDEARTEPPPAPEPASFVHDPNPCTDSSCLNQQV